MKLFDSDNPIAVSLSKLIHDTNGQIGLHKYWAKKLKDEEGIPDLLIDLVKGIQDSIDTFYKDFQKW